jgi:lysophospholipase L1-like esterase
LAAFHAALRQLEKRERRHHVRVLWLGDSHAQADYWSGALRKGLQARFGRGGPGFVHVGFKSYRHDEATFNVRGTWLLRPKGPSTSVATGDGSFGLGGILLRGSGASATAEVTSSDLALKTPLTWDLCYKLDAADDELVVELTGSAEARVQSAPGEAPGALRHLVLTSTAPATLKVTPRHGKPELCGVVIEANADQGPGVVVDTLGINGARYGTALAWNETTWASELVRRAPELVILEYGTNELSDRGAPPEVHVKRMSSLVDRVRRHVPNVSCLVLAPTDRADRQAIEPALVEALESGAGAKGCAFWNTVEAMGGPGSIVTLKNETPPRAAKDGIHLNPRGYRYLGDRLLGDLLREVPP